MGRRDGDANLQSDSDMVRAEGRALRDVSRRLLDQIEEIRHLELQARTLAIGTPEFERVSAQITARSREIFGLAGEQEQAAAALSPRDVTIEQLDAAEDGQPPASG